LSLRSTFEISRGLLFTILLWAGFAPGTDTRPLEDSPAGGLQDLPSDLAARIGTRSTHLENEKAIAILSGLGNAATGAIEDLARSAESRRRLAAVKVLAGRGAAADLLAFLGDRSHAVRRAALDGLEANFGCGLESLLCADANSVDAIVPLLGDPFWPVRRAAVAALCASRNPRAAPGVLRALHDREPEVRRTALLHLGDLAADLSIADLEAAAAGLSEGEVVQLLRSVLPLARPDNAPFFRELALSTKKNTIALVAFMAAVAAGDRPARAEIAGPRMSWVIEQSIERSGVAEDAADTLVGWLAENEEAPFVAAIENALADDRLPPAAVTKLLWDALGQKAIPVLEGWAHKYIGRAAIVAHCLTHLDTGGTDEGAAALARLLPKLDGAARERAVKKAVNYMEILDRGEGHPGLESLRHELTRIALNDPPQTGLGAFGAVCRFDDLSAPLAEKLFERFRNEERRGVRESLLRRLAEAGDGPHRAALARLFIDEIAGGRPAAIIAAATIHRVIGKGSDSGDAAGAIIALCDRTADAVQREVLLLALVGLNDRTTDSYVARHVEDLWSSEGLGGVGRLATALGRFDGPLTADVLRRMARPRREAPGEELDLARRALNALVTRRDRSAIAIVDEVFDRLSSGSRIDLVDRIKRHSLDGDALRFLEKIIDTEQDSDILAMAIESIDESTIRSRRQTLLEIAEDATGAAGRAASGAAILALGRIGDEEALRLFKQWAAAFLEEGEAAPPAFFDLLYDRPNRILLALRALGINGDGDAPDLLAGLLLQHQRALSDATILESWEARAGGSEERPDHSWPANVLKTLLIYDDSVVEQALFDRLEKMERSGDLFLLGDAIFSVLHFELAKRKRCPALRERFGALVFACRPDHSPAEFRLSVDRGERAAAAGRSRRAAEHYLRAYHILRYHTPAKEVVRQLLADSDSFAGYAPAPSLISEVHALLADAMVAEGDDGAAARLARRARELSPFARRVSGGPPLSRPPEMEEKNRDR